MKFTAKTLKELVGQLNEKMGRPTTYRDKDRNILIGHITLDYYNGYQLQEITNTGGGVHDRVLGLPWAHRLSAKEMGYFLMGALACFDSKAA